MVIGSIIANSGFSQDDVYDYTQPQSTSTTQSGGDTYVTNNYYDDDDITMNNTYLPTTTNTNITTRRAFVVSITPYTVTAIIVAIM
ncbi:MAG: hypothetical protein IPN94_16225 [Sphingobacteriales bacterium]|nr:hypothetical protein [Sphingobacteriales bacterium]